MHVTVTDGCISCGLCADEFPELFHLNDEGVAEAVPSTVASDQEVFSTPSTRMRWGRV